MRRISSSATHVPDAYASDDIGIYTMNDFEKKKKQNQKNPTTAGYSSQNVEGSNSRNSGALGRTKRAQRSTMSKKIW